MGQGRLRRAWSWLWSPANGSWRAKPNGECPICGHPVVLAPTRWLGTQHSGPMMAPRTRQEVVAACPEHGRSPYNDAARALRDKRR